MQKIIASIAVALVFTASAAATRPPPGDPPWAKSKMLTALRALGYPKPHPLKLTCKDPPQGRDVGIASFACTATYKHHVRRRFVAAGQGEGGWLCAGKTLAGCKLLRRGFVTTAAAAVYPSLSGAAQIAAEGYLADHDQFPYQVVHFCTQASASSWSCPFLVNNAPVTVTISLKKAKGGYVVSGSG
jgi:hypothetical protein